MISFCLDLVRTLDPGECHLAEEGFVGVVTHDPRQTQAFERFLLILYRHPQPPQYTDQQRLIGVYGSGKIGAGTERAPHVCPAHPRHCRRHGHSDKVLAPCPGAPLITATFEPRRSGAHF
jgi:hypothetical protein